MTVNTTGGVAKPGPVRAPAPYRPESPKIAQPTVAQPRVAPAAPGVYRPQPLPLAAPPVYRPEAPKIAQPKVATVAQPRVAPAAPGVYRPQPLSVAAPPVYRPEGPKIAQPKIAAVAQARVAPAAPPIYHPQRLPLAPPPVYRLNAQGSAQPKMASFVLAPAAPGKTIVQMFKYVRARTGKVFQVADDYSKKGKEKWATEDDFLNNPVTGQADIAEAIRQAREEARRAVEEERLRREEERRAREEAERLRREREAQRQRLIAERKPKVATYKQMHFPKVVVREGETVTPADTLIYRGMSVNNIKNLKKAEASWEREGVVFSAQKPKGTATPEQHIVDDSQESPYLSFEAENLAISAGKYSAKPVDPDSKKPLGVEKKEGGFLKQQKSYTAKSRRDFPTAKRIGYVGGISTQGREVLDYSTETKARSLTVPKARELAVADAEILVKPGEGGILKSQVPFVAKVQEVTKEYHDKWVGKQSARKAVGYYKSSTGTPVYHKIQIPSKYTGEKYEFDIPEELLGGDDDSDMSDVESIDLNV